MGDPGEADLRLMRQAIAAGGRALGRAWPNPAVGCVIARHGEAVGEGWTGDGGRPHAEEQALLLAGNRARGSTAYVTLEPCCIRSAGGPACSSLLVEAAISRVVIACEDPTANAAGGGLARLRAAGVQVDVGLLSSQAAGLSAGFVHRIATGQPLLEAADTSAGFDGPFEPEPGESLKDALERYGAAGYTRLWTPRSGAIAARLARLG